MAVHVGGRPRQVGLLTVVGPAGCLFVIVVIALYNYLDIVKHNNANLFRRTHDGKSPEKQVQIVR